MTKMLIDGGLLISHQNDKNTERVNSGGYMSRKALIRHKKIPRIKKLTCITAHWQVDGFGFIQPRTDNQ